MPSANERGENVCVPPPFRSQLVSRREHSEGKQTSAKTQSLPSSMRSHTEQSHSVREKRRTTTSFFTLHSKSRFKLYFRSNNSPVSGQKPQFFGPVLTVVARPTRNSLTKTPLCSRDNEDGFHIGHSFACVAHQPCTHYTSPLPTGYIHACACFPTVALILFHPQKRHKTHRNGMIQALLLKSSGNRIVLE